MGSTARNTSEHGSHYGTVPRVPTVGECGIVGSVAFVLLSPRPGWRIGRCGLAPRLRDWVVGTQCGVHRTTKSFDTTSQICHMGVRGGVVVVCRGKQGVGPRGMGLEGQGPCPGLLLGRAGISRRGEVRRRQGIPTRIGR